MTLPRALHRVRVGGVPLPYLVVDDPARSTLGQETFAAGITDGQNPDEMALPTGTDGAAGAMANVPPRLLAPPASAHWHYRRRRHYRMASGAGEIDIIARAGRDERLGRRIALSATKSVPA